MLGEEKGYVLGARKGELLSQKVTSQNSHGLSDHLAGENRVKTMVGLHLGTNCLALHPKPPVRTPKTDMELPFVSLLK